MRIHTLCVVLLAGTLPLIGTSCALAQSNTISILQEGRGNTLSVDQSDASGSTVGGLEIMIRGQQSGQLVINGQRQTTTRTETTGEFVKDAAGAIVPGPDGEPVPVTKTIIDPVIRSATELEAVFNPKDPGPARQLGNDNVAEVTVSGVGGYVGLLQDNSQQTRALGNLATISLDGNGTALVGQAGAGNVANLSVSGDGALGSILQRGIGNDVALDVIGNGARGAISQLGNNNNSSLSVSGAAGSSVTYVLQGNGVSSFNPSAGVEVTTNAENVTITQSQF